MSEEVNGTVRSTLLNPVPIAGAVISVGVAIVLYLAEDAGATTAVLTGIVGASLTFQIHMIAILERGFHHASSLAKLVDDAEVVPGLSGRVRRFVTAAKTLYDQFGDHTPAAAVIRQQFDEVNDTIASLLRGHIPSDKSTFLSLVTAETRRSLVATSLQSVDLARWSGLDWEAYWSEQVAALGRGVMIQRVFIYDDWTAELEELARKQRNAGIDVKRVASARLVAAGRSDLLVDIILWDDTCGCQLVATNSQGELLANAFTWADSDIARIRSMYRTIHAVAEVYVPHA